MTNIPLASSTSTHTLEMRYLVLVTANPFLLETHIHYYYTLSEI